MRKITILVLGFFLLFSAGKAMALTPLPSCNSDNDCASGYRCVYMNDDSTGRGFCAKTYVGVTAVPTKVMPTMACKSLWWIDNTNKECSQKQFCGAYVYQGLQTFTTVAECKKSLLPTNCEYKKCGDANCDGRIGTQDLLIWIKERNGTGRTADFNGDGKVDVKDYTLLKNGITRGCGLITPSPKISQRPTAPVTQVPAYTCEMLYKKSLIGSQNYFKLCSSSGYEKVCFNKFTAEYQGCGAVDRDTCTEFNTNAARNIQCNSSVGVGPTGIVTSTPPTPVLSQIVNWTTKWASFTASDYQVQVSDGTSSGRVFKVNPSKPCNMVTGETLCINSNPPGLNSNGLHYMTLEVTWFENDIEMRMFIYLYSDGKRWWSNEIRVYNGQARPNTDWVYFYGKFFDTPVGQSFSQSGKFSLNAADPRNGNSPVTLSFSNVRFEAFKNYFNQITRVPTKVPGCDLNYLNFIEACGVGISGEKTYRYVEYRCGNDTLRKMGGPTSCKSTDTWKRYAYDECQKGCGALSPSPSKPTMPPPSPMVCNRSGDADGDGKVTLRDYAIWKFEYSTKKPNKSDFNCDRVIDLSDYQIWKNAFLAARELVVTTNN